MTSDFNLDDNGFLVENGVLVKFDEYYYEDSLNDLYVPEGVTEIGSNAFVQDEDDDFAGVRGLTKVTLPTTCTVLRQGAFYSCQELQEVKCLAKLELLEEGVFSDCNNLEFCVGVPKEQTIIPDHLYDRAGISHVRFPNHVTEVGFSAFYDVVNLNDLNLNKVEKINTDAFYHCGLENGLYIPTTVKVIECEAFRDAMAPYIIIENASTIIKDGAFNGMFKVEFIEIPNGMDVPNDLWGIKNKEQVEIRRK